MAFPCPSCGSHSTRVSNTEKKGYSVKRYIRCSDCALRFRTIERSETTLKRVRPKQATSPTSGERNGNAVLSAANIRQIRSELAAGTKRSVLALRYGVSASSISRIANRQVWRKV